MRVGIVCPYAWDTPGGVSAHVHDLANALLRMGHSVSVLAPAESDDGLPPFVVSTGRPRAVRYNGSVARLAFGPVSAYKVSRWVRNGGFDVLHVHEPLAPSLSVLACWVARGPIVATWHSSMRRSRMLLSLNRLATTAMEKVTARIAVSEAARTTLVHHIGGDAVIIPNGVDVASFAPAHPRAEWTGSGPSVVFLGRLNEPRKGLQVLMAALPLMRLTHPDLRVLVAGPGDPSQVTIPSGCESAVLFLGRLSDQDKAAALASADVYVAPNTGGESFGIVLLEAMAAGTPVVASDLEAFVRVLGYGAAGRTFHNGDSESLAQVTTRLLADPSERDHLRAAGRARAAQFDWSLVASEVVDVYEAVVQPGVRVVSDLLGQMVGRWAR